MLFTILGSFSSRYSLFYWMCASAVILPVLFLKGWRFGISAVIATTIAVALAVSPMDFVIQRGSVGIHILPTSYGIVTIPGTVGYGCSVSNPPSHACVLSF